MSLRIGSSVPRAVDVIAMATAASAEITFLMPSSATTVERQREAEQPRVERSTSAAPTEFLSVDLVAGEQEQHAEAEFAQDADRFAVSLRC